MSVRLYTPTPEEVDAAIAALVRRQPGERTRFAKAAAYVLAGAVGHDDSGWTVTSQDKYRKGTVYQVVGGNNCTCWDFEHSGKCCKHLDALAIFGRCLAAKLDAAMPVPPEEIYRRVWLETGSEENGAAAADAACDSVLGDDVIFFIPGAESNRTHVYDRVSGDCILTAQQQPSGAWRPATAADTLAWARWLGAQQASADVVDEVPVTDPEPTGFAARAAMWAELADREPITIGIPKNPYKSDVRSMAMGHAPVHQLQHEANLRRRATQAQRAAQA